MNLRLKRLLLATLLAGLTAGALRADHIYMLIDNGNIGGEITSSPWEDWFWVGTFSQAVEVPFDLETGQVTGVRRHAPVYVSISMSHPAAKKLVNALSTSTNFPEVVFKFLYINDQLLEEAYFEIKLENVFLSLVGSNYDPGPDAGPPFYFIPNQSLAFYYQKITWTYYLSDPDIVYQDTWDASSEKRSSHADGMDPGDLDGPDSAHTINEQEQWYKATASSIDGLEQTEIQLGYDKYGALLPQSRAEDAFPSRLYRYRLKKPFDPAGGLLFIGNARYP